jgi:hypothetical protein
LPRPEPERRCARSFRVVKVIRVILGIQRGCYEENRLAKVGARKAYRVIRVNKFARVVRVIRVIRVNKFVRVVRVVRVISVIRFASVVYSRAVQKIAEIRSEQSQIEAHFSLS